MATIDARPIIAEGGEPLDAIMAAIADLATRPPPNALNRTFLAIKWEGR
jgi:hypothetical protein